MYIEELQAKSVRNLSEILIKPGPGLNVLVGKNASGKTAVLEAIYFLSRARSFRTTRIKEVVQHGKEYLQVSAKVHPLLSSSVATGIEKGGGKTTIRYNGEAVRTVSSQARQVPLVLITPDSHQLVTGSPKQRRHWLDWAMFHVEQDYIDWWRSYHKALRQRNILLRSSKINGLSSIEGWEKEMVRAAESIQNARQKFVSRLIDCLRGVLGEELSTEPEIILKKGWADEKQLLELLSEHREQDRLAGYTRHGPHKADLGFYLSNSHKALAAVCSRGQIKLFVNTLLVAQAQAYEFYNREKPVFLLDDFSAELDQESQKQLLNLLQNQSAQVFLTATDLGPKEDINDNITLFHVEHGRVIKITK